ncbi:SMAD/FHA domain-containing protein [Xylariaceae sp. FL0594]|nr:SMAD/FHA domain-containing protein [Xylariaceae sp. FL0594]
MNRSRSATTGTLADMSSSDALPSIRLSSFYDPRSTRPSLAFTPVTRTLPTGRERIKVGRYSEREAQAYVAQTPSNTPSGAPIGFKSKVVSRRHCEFWFEKGKWFIKDVKSSSGTFLNHIRLSAPGTESKPYPINDGDIVQLGIDFKGGEEMIYRCVKMRVELNRGWQSKPNIFNMATHKLLRDMTSPSASPGSHTQDCSICLNAIAPCQSLFVAPCSHTWHFKCIREMLHGPSWPVFMCPNCRATADLDAEVDEPMEDWPEILENEASAEKAKDKAAVQPSASLSPLSPSLAANGNLHARRMSTDESGDVTMLFSNVVMPPPAAGPPRHTVSDPVPIPSGSLRRTPSPVGNSLLNHREGPITPRNDAGPWVFDGNPARVSQENTRRNGMGSLDAATKPTLNQS